jgi:hypothetical protein
MSSHARNPIILLATVLLSLLAVEATAADSIGRVSNATPRRDREGNILDAHDGCLQKFGNRYYGSFE